MSEAAAELGERIYGRAHLTGEFRLRSGAVSSEYFDKYLFESDPRQLREIAQALVAMLPSGVEVLAGLELGGVQLAVVAAQVCGVPAVLVRKTAKAEKALPSRVLPCARCLRLHALLRATDHAHVFGIATVAFTRLAAPRRHRHCCQRPRRNIELKARDPDPAASLEVCRRLGAEDHAEITQRDTNYVPKLASRPLAFTGRLEQASAGAGRARLLAEELLPRVLRVLVHGS